MPSDGLVFSNFQSFIDYFPEVMSTNSVHEPIGSQFLEKKSMNTFVPEPSYRRKVREKSFGNVTFLDITTSHPFVP